MKRSRIICLHVIAALTAWGLILSFFTLTIISKLSGHEHFVVLVKDYTVHALWCLVPALVVTARTGMKLGASATHPLILQKKARMPLIALNGILVLVPASLYLYSKAILGDFGTGYQVVQLIELMAGAVNFTLLTLNLRDGLNLRQKVSIA